MMQCCMLFTHVFVFVLLYSGIGAPMRKLCVHSVSAYTCFAFRGRNCGACFAWAAEHRRGPACGTEASDFMSARGTQTNQLDNDEWACKVCTFLNHSRHLICGMCHTERGASTASGGAGQALAEPGVQAGADTTADDESIVLASAAMHPRRRGRGRRRDRRRPAREPPASTSTAASSAEMQASEGTDGEKWWHKLAFDLCDPITLEPLQTLAYPPFELGSRTSTPPARSTHSSGRGTQQGSATCATGRTPHAPSVSGTSQITDVPEETAEHTACPLVRGDDAGCNSQLQSQLFDGCALASYLISSLVFLNPLSREPVTRDECVRLDEYLSCHGLCPLPTGGASGDPHGRMVLHAPRPQTQSPSMSSPKGRTKGKMSSAGGSDNTEIGVVTGAYDSVMAGTSASAAAGGGGVAVRRHLNQRQRRRQQQQQQRAAGAADSALFVALFGDSSNTQMTRDRNSSNHEVGAEAAFDIGDAGGARAEPHRISMSSHRRGSMRASRQGVAGAGMSSTLALDDAAAAVAARTSTFDLSEATMQPHPVHNQLVPSHLQTRARGGARRRARQLKNTEQTRARRVQRAAAAASAAARGAALADAVAEEAAAILGDDGLLMIDDDLVPHAVSRNVVRATAQQHMTTHDGTSSTDQHYLPCRGPAHPDNSMRQDPWVNDMGHSSGSGSASFPALLPPAELARRREQQRMDHEHKAVTAAHAARVASAAAHAACLSAASAEWDTTIERRVLRALEMSGGSLAASDVVGLLGALLKNNSTNEASESFNNLEQLSAAEKERRWARIKSVMGEVASLSRSTRDSDALFWQLRDTHSGRLAAELAAEAAAAAIGAAIAAARAAMEAVNAAEAGPPLEQAITTWSPSLVEWARREPRLVRRIEREIEPLFHSNLHPTTSSVQLKHMGRSDRKHVHEMCEICGLHSASFNDARGRYVSVTVLPDTHAPSVALSLVASVPAAVLRRALATAAMAANGAAHAARVAAACYPVAMAAAAAIGASATAAQCADCAVETAEAARSPNRTKQSVHVSEIAKERSATPVPSEHQSGATDLSASSSSTSSDDEFFLALAK